MDWAMEERSYSQRRACALAGIDPRVYRRKSKRPKDTELRDRMKALASERRRFGYRRLHILLRREGWEVNWKKLYRLYREEGLTVRKRGGRKRVIGTSAPMTIPQGPTQRWSLDFVSDALSDGRRFRILCVIDDFSRECLATVVDTSLSGHRVARELCLGAIAVHDRPRHPPRAEKIRKCPHAPPCFFLVQIPLRLPCHAARRLPRPPDAPMHCPALEIAVIDPLKQRSGRA